MPSKKELIEQLEKEGFKLKKDLKKGELEKLLEEKKKKKPKLTQMIVPKAYAKLKTNVPIRQQVTNAARKLGIDVPKGVRSKKLANQIKEKANDGDEDAKELLRKSGILEELDMDPFKTPQKERTEEQPTEEEQAKKEATQAKMLAKQKSAEKKQEERKATQAKKKQEAELKRAEVKKRKEELKEESAAEAAKAEAAAEAAKPKNTRARKARASKAEAAAEAAADDKPSEPTQAQEVASETFDPFEGSGYKTPKAKKAYKAFMSAFKKMDKKVGKGYKVSHSITK